MVVGTYHVYITVLNYVTARILATTSSTHSTFEFMDETAYLSGTVA